MGKSYQPTSDVDGGLNEPVSGGTPDTSLASLMGNSAMQSTLPLGRADNSCDYTVQPGDTLWDISRRQTGSGAGWSGLYDRNRSVVGDNPDLIFPGQHLDVCQPPAQTSSTSPTTSPTAPSTTSPSGPGPVKGPFGETTVYPNDFVGPLPPGTFRQGDYDKMVALYQKIDSGKSQVSVDTSNFTAGIDPATEPEKYKKALEDAAAFKGQTMGNLAELMKTPLGMQFLTDMDASKHTTTIKKGSTNETNPDSDAGTHDGVGTNATITINPDLTTYQEPGQAEQPWMTERPKFGLYHEMLHAYHMGRGDEDQGSHTGVNANTGAERDIRNWEWQVMGEGPFSTEKYTDNKFRDALGKDERPGYSPYLYKK